jgi:hypothetical protein
MAKSLGGVSMPPARAMLLIHMSNIFSSPVNHSGRRCMGRKYLQKQMSSQLTIIHICHDFFS